MVRIIKRKLKTFKIILMAQTLCLLAIALNAQESESVGDKLVEDLKLDGGIALVLGDSSMAMALDLSKGGRFYVQVLQAELKKSLAWGKQIVDTPARENISIREAVFAAESYDTNLFNLIIVQDTKALNKATIEDLYRILIPHGVVLFKSGGGDFAAKAKELEMVAIEKDKLGSFASGFSKPLKPVVWKLPMAQKWRSGAVSQISNGYKVAGGDGKLFYMERMEKEGSLRNSSVKLFARDGYNGRTLWTRILPGSWWRPQMVANKKGRIFLRVGVQLWCIDGSTGKTLIVMEKKINREARFRLIRDNLLSVNGVIYSTETGKRIWSFPKYKYQPVYGAIIKDTIYFPVEKANWGKMGSTIWARNLKDGAELWKKPMVGVIAPNTFHYMGVIGDKLIVRMKTKSRKGIEFSIVDTDGKLLWSYKGMSQSGDRKIRITHFEGKVIIYARQNKKGVYADEVIVDRLDLQTGKRDGEITHLKEAGDYHGCFPEIHLGEYVVYYDLWIHKKTLKTQLFKMPHPACFSGMNSKNGFVYNFPSRKSHYITADGPSDYKYPGGARGQLLKKSATATSSDATKQGDWPMFRGNLSGGNSINAKLGSKLEKLWETQIGLKNKSFGHMSSQRTGLTQAVSAYGLSIVSDIDGQRIVALNSADGKQKWSFHVGGRVDLSPTLYKGLCLFTSRNGWVYCLDVTNGSLVYKILVPATERFMGGRDGLEPMSTINSDVYVVNDIAYVTGLAFKPETGEKVDSKKPKSRKITLHYSNLLKGNSIPRTNEDNAHGFRKGKLDARVLAFDKDLTVAYNFKPAGEGWANKGKLFLRGIEKNPKKPLWQTAPFELVVDDIVVTPEYIYCAGHYQRIAKKPEVWVVSRKDGSVMSTFTLESMPAFFGMSVVNNNLLVATRDGKLICFKKSEK